MVTLGYLRGNVKAIFLAIITLIWNVNPKYNHRHIPLIWGKCSCAWVAWTKPLPGMTMVGGAAASVLRQRRPPLANLSHSKVMCFFSRLVSLGRCSWLLRFKACSFELFNRQVFKRWERAASTVSSQPWMQKPILKYMQRWQMSKADTLLLTKL